MLDLVLYETGNGGDLVATTADLDKTASFYNMIYLALFGGNVEASTRGDELPNEERFDYWANSLIFPEEPGLQFNSNTERVLNESPITSASRLRIEEVVKDDLKFMEEFGGVEVYTEILGIDQLGITAIIIEPDAIENKVFRFIWDATKKQLITDWVAGSPFSYPKRNILINGVFNGGTNWNIVNYLNGIVTAFNMSLSITVGSGGHLFAVYSGQKFTPGKKYRISFECVQFGVDPTDSWGVGFGSNSAYYQREGDDIEVTATGSYSAEITAPASPADPDNLRMVINSPSAVGTAGTFEIKKITVKPV